jgi:hypothetical protein
MILSFLITTLCYTFYVSCSCYLNYALNLVWVSIFVSLALLEGFRVFLVALRIGEYADNREKMRFSLKTHISGHTVS